MEGQVTKKVICFFGLEDIFFFFIGNEVTCSKCYVQIFGLQQMITLNSRNLGQTSQKLH